VGWDLFVQSSQTVQQYLELANSKQKTLINNNRALRQRNG